jgi:phytoene synthase
VTEQELNQSYEVCRRMHRRHDPTFYLAARRLPADVRPAVHALYGFVRGADELVDGPRRAPDPAARLRDLDRWEAELHRGLATGRSRHPVMAALVDAGRRHALPLGELDEYMTAMRVDCGPVRIDTAADLDRYMLGIAGPVGRIMAPLLGCPEDRREEIARLGLAFQLTNIVRDVREDRALDRVYLPREALERHGVDTADLDAARATAGLRALLAGEVARARRLFDESAPALDAVGPSVRLGMRFARALYLRVLDRVEAAGFDVLRRSAGVRPWDYAGAVLTTARRAA